MKSVLIVTRVDFWRKGAGHRSRLTSLINYIKDHFSITIVYAGIVNSRDSVILGREYPSIAFVPLEPNKTISFKEHGELFRSFIAGKHFDIALIEYLEMSFVLPMLGENTFTILDTHDLVSDRIESFNKNKLRYDSITLTYEEEISVFNCFDKVLLIQDKDYNKIGKQLGFDRTLLVPHAAALNKKILRNEVRNIGFVGSEYMPNSDGISWFVNNAWLAIDDSLTLNIYGKVCDRIAVREERVKLHGFVDDVGIAYNHCDIMINPVKCGAGIKIKNIEALSCGLPLITNSHGAIGIDTGKERSFIVADTADEFAAALAKLVKDQSYRKELGNNAFLFAQENFSPAACYQQLVDCMLECQLTE
ncbi:MAG: glycosyltransferase family 4 protein [Bacteroidota bacterium]